MRYLLDTNACVDYLNARHAKVVARVQAAAPDDLLDVFMGELQCLDFDLEAASTYGRVRARLEAAGTPIGPNDMMIAALALSRGLVLVTDNTGEFRRVPGLKVENWR